MTNTPGRRAMLLLTLAALIAGPARAQLSPDWVDGWIADLEVLRTSLPEEHADAFHTISRQEWNAEIDALVARVPELDHAEIVVELARVVARIGDGHTRLTLPLAAGVSFPQGHSSTPAPALPELVFHAYPVRFGIDDMGVYVVEVDRAHEWALGARVLRLGAMSADEAVAAVEPTIRRDNRMQVLHHLPMHLALAEMLHARGVTPTRHSLELVLEDREGNGRSLTLEVSPEDAIVDWARIPAATAAARLAASHSDAPFAFEYLPRERAVYFRFNEVTDTREEPLRVFARRLENRLSRTDVDTLIVDLRENRGGNTWLARAVLKAIVRGGQDRPGHLFALVGRSTFSAAMNFSLMLEEYTQVTFVGEPTGARPNSYGDSRRVRLPNTNLTVRVSSRYHQNNYTDGRSAISPDLPVAYDRQAYLSGSDPVLETVLGLAAAPPDSLAEGVWEGRLKSGLNTFSIEVEIRAGGEVLVDVPGLEIRGTRASRAVLERGRVSFALESSRGVLPFEGEVRRGWIVGSYVSGGVVFPFTLRHRE